MSIPVRPMRFLLIEDEDAHAELIRLALLDGGEGHAVDHVIDGEKALQFLRQEGAYEKAERPDLILLDLKLPGMDGHELLRQIKADPNLRPIPVVALSTSANEADRTRAYANYVNSFLTKPIDMRKFQEMLNDVKHYWTVWNVPPTNQMMRSVA